MHTAPGACLQCALGAVCILNTVLEYIWLAVFFQIIMVQDHIWLTIFWKIIIGPGSYGSKPKSKKKKKLHIFVLHLFLTIERRKQYGKICPSLYRSYFCEISSCQYVFYSMLGMKVFFKTSGLRGYCTPSQNLACSVLNLKIINIFLKNNIRILY